MVEPSGCDNGDVSRYGNQLVRGQIVKILNPVTHVFDFFLVGGPSNNQDIMALVSLASGDMFPINPEGTYSVLGLGTTLYLKQGFNTYPQNYNGGLEPADFD